MIEHDESMNKRTKIVATLGPSSETSDVIKQMVEGGMNIARLNFSHGTYDNHLLLIERIRDVEKTSGQCIGILQDIQGPKIRIGALESPRVLEKGDDVIFDTSSEVQGSHIPLDFSDLHQYVHSGDRLFLCDGNIETRITRVEGTNIYAEVRVGGEIISHKGINVPDTSLPVRVLTEKDKQDIRFGVKNGVDMIALSFVRNAKDISDARAWIESIEKEENISGQPPIRLIAKIERKEAVENMTEILEVADGIMIARGDLGIEIPDAEVPIAQRNLIDVALRAAKPVIVATQMLDSMQANPRPTRAEVSDVAHAVMDHTDAVMLSNETATGTYPVDAVRIMGEIIEQTEKSVYDNLPLRDIHSHGEILGDVMSELTRLLGDDIKAKAIITASFSGDIARHISRYRPEMPIVAGTETLRVCHQLNLSWGVVPVQLLPCDTVEVLKKGAISYIKNHQLGKSGDQVIVVSGNPVGDEKHVNVLEVVHVT